jgi:hypothetical protein
MLNGMPEEHAWQIQGNLYVTHRSYADFISYDPRMPEGLKLYVQRIERDEKMISLIEENVDQFLTEVDAMVTKLREIQNV